MVRQGCEACRTAGRHGAFTSGVLDTVASSGLVAAGSCVHMPQNALQLWAVDGVVLWAVVMARAVYVGCMFRNLSGHHHASSDDGWLHNFQSGKKASKGFKIGLVTLLSKHRTNACPATVSCAPLGAINMR